MRTPAPSTSPMEQRRQDAMALYDAYWFRRLVLRSYESPPPAPPPQQEAALQRAASYGLRHRRTRSDEAATTAAAFDGLEPLKIQNNNHRARLETILSGKDGLSAAPQRRRQGGRRRRRQQRGRSMSELEFEEVKGLRDLGFTFSEDEVDAELASIVPGLRQRREEEEDAQKASAAEVEACRNTAATGTLRRPYLSEAWEDEEEVRTVPVNIRFPAAADDGADLKEHLRLWAHTVASAVR